MDIPTHVAIIPDGNRRWAKEKNLPPFEGHRVAAEKTLPALLEKAADLGIKYFTFWALSTDNFKSRDEKEIKNLLQLIRYFITNKLDEFKKKKVRLKIIGNISVFPDDLQREIKKAIKETENNSKIVLVLGLNYGGRDEIIRAIEKVMSYELGVRGINQDNFNQFLDTKDLPDPDLIIRTGKEKRLSGFMPWQSEYSELYFSDLFFPDFTPQELEKIVLDYTNRQRRFGK